MKKVISSLLIIAMLFSLLPMTIHAEESPPVSVAYCIGEESDEIGYATITEIGTISLNKKTSGKVFLASLPQNATIKAVDFTAPSGDKAVKQLVNKQDKLLKDSDLVAAYTDSANYFVDSDFISTNSKSTFYKQFTKLQTLNEDGALPTRNVKGFVIRQAINGTGVNVLYVQIANLLQEVNKTALKVAIIQKMTAGTAEYQVKKGFGKILKTL